MKSLSSLLLSGHIAETIARITPNPLLRSGASALAVRWAMRSVPAALAVVAAGAAYRYFTKDGAATKRKPASRTTSHRKAPAAKRTASKSRTGRAKAAPAAAAA